ncbi:MAG: nucleotidyltransferase family protein [Candidatus Hodarchaeota archaeon]
MSNEEKLVMYVVCTSINERVLHKIKEILSTDLNWRFVLGRAIHHRVIPKFYQSLTLLTETELKNLIPNWVLEKVRELNYAFIGRNIVIQEEINKIFKSLKVRGIEFTPIKGVLLAETIYPKNYFRFLLDIDLLFPNDNEKIRAEEILVNLGYKLIWDAVSQSLFRKNGNIPPIFCDSHRFLTLFRYFEYPKIDDLWKNMSEQKVGGVKVKVLSGEHMLLVLCLHSFKHKSFLLQDLCDAIQILRKYPNLDWQYILEQLEKYPCVFGIPLGIINVMFNYLFNENIMPKTAFKVLRYVNVITAKVGGISAKQTLENPEKLAPYEIFCPKCDNYIHCPIYFPDSNSKVKNGRLGFIKNMLLEYYYILTSIKRTHGIKYALKCFYQQSIGFLGRIFHFQKFY